MTNHYFSCYLHYFSKVWQSVKLRERRAGMLLLIGIFLLTTATAQAQSITVSGKVQAEDGGPLPGVSVIEKGTTNGVTTDFDGNYSITVKGAQSILTFSYVGFTTQSKTVGQNRTFNITMIEELSLLDEVVVIGYGTAKKSDLTGSVVSVSAEDIKNAPVANVSESLTGRLAGVQITTTEGSPDAEINIRVRGGGSITQDSSPLLIVDGFPVNSINDISPSDIENITVLKDASSTAIYGSRGANGVVIVTTKKGSDGKIAVSFNSFYGRKTIANTIDVLDPEDYVKWQYEFFMLEDADDLRKYENVFGTYQDIDQYAGMKGNNWQRQIYGRTGEVHSQDLSLRGGTQKFNYNLNYARFDEKAIMIGSDFVRNNISAKFNTKPSDKIDLSLTFRYSDTEINGGGANEQNEVSSADARLKHSIGYSPIPLPGFTSDDTDEATFADLVNPFLAVDDNQRLQERKNYNLLGSFSWDIFDNVSFKSDFGLDTYNYLDYRFYGRTTYYASNSPLAENQGLPALRIMDRKDVRFRNANTLNIDFNKYVGDNQSLKLLIGQEYINYTRNEVTSQIHGFPKMFNFDQAKKLTTQGEPFSIDNNYSPDDILLSFFGRVNYDLFNKYLLTATFRADGSSKFLDGNRWGYFPSAAFAWKVKEEEFLRDADWLTTLKLRLSYGEAGNNNIPVGQTVQNFESSNTSFINGVDSYWAAAKILANPDLTWETTVTQNAGLDYGFFRGRLSGSFEVYKNLTKDVLLQFPVAGTGYDFQYRNMGESQNKGVEASLNWIALEKENYGLSFAFNIGINRGRINSLGIMDNFGFPTGWASTSISNDFLVNVGMPIGIMQGYKHDGRYEVSDFDYSGGEYTLKADVADASAVVGDVFPGMMKLKDISGPDGVPDGIVDVNDLTIIGDANAKHTGGFVINANAYGFDMMASFNWSYGNDIYNANKIQATTATRSPNAQYRNLSSIMADGNRWTYIDPASGQLVSDPAALTTLNQNTTMWSPYMQRFVFSDWAVEDGSFLRLNTLTLGYTLPNDVVNKIGLSRLRFYGTAYNVFNLTNYSGLDPEVSTRRRTPLTPGVDYSPYPRSRQMVFGFNLNF